MSAAKPPLAALSSFYFFYFASVGAFVPFWSLYLASLGFSALEIGELNGVLIASKIVAPNLWGWLADRSGRHLHYARLGSIAAALLSFCLIAADQYWQLMAVSLVLGFFWNAVLSQYEVVALNHLSQRRGLYGKVRLWGSLGFIVTVLLLGQAIDYVGYQALVAAVIATIVAIAVVTIITPRAPVMPIQSVTSLLRSLYKPPVIALLVVCFLIQASHGPYYTFFSLYLEQAGYSKTVSGALWALGVLAEIAVFLATHWLFSRFGARRLMLVAALVTGLRWIMLVVFVDSLALMLVVQIAHMATFGLYHAVAIQLFHRYFPGALQGQGQALYSSVSFGAGGALGAWLAGITWDSAGADITFIGAGVVALLAAIICLIGFEKRLRLEA